MKKRLGWPFKDKRKQPIGRKENSLLSLEEILLVLSLVEQKLLVGRLS